VGIYPEIEFKEKDSPLFRLNDRNPQIKIIKQKLARIGYLVNPNFSAEFDLEMQHLVRVFNRRFNHRVFTEEKQDCWMSSSNFVLEQIEKPRAPMI
jgi:N-acetyl-anhydromuramyl-L-alanine amidase AmpD